MPRSKKISHNILRCPWVKQIILTILPLLIGVLASALGMWDQNTDAFFNYKLVAIIILFVAEIFFLILYSKWDSQKEQELQELQAKLSEYQKIRNELSIFKRELIDISTISRDTSRDLNLIADSMVERGIIDLNVWSYSKGCKEICSCAYNIICKVSKCGSGFAVNYIQKIVTSDGKIYLEVPASEGTSDDPDLKGEQRLLEDLSNYFYAKQFTYKNPSIIIFSNPDEIVRNFVFPKAGGNKYEQYIGVPVLCSGNKMIGLLQIVALKGSLIADDYQSLRKIAEDYFSPLATFAMLMNKIEKAATAIPNQKETHNV